MAIYGDTNTKVKVFIHDGNPGDQGGSVGTLAKDVYDYISALDSTNNEVLSVTQSHVGGGRILTMITAGT